MCREVSLTALLAVMLGVGCKPAPTSHDVHAHTAGSAPAAASPFAREMDAGMAVMMERMHQPGYSGNPDIDFLRMMIPHHEGAVEMARLELVHGKDPLTRQVAVEIIAAQTIEIAAMKRRLEILSGARPDGQGDFPALEGTRGGTAEMCAPPRPAQPGPAGDNSSPAPSPAPGRQD